jgi:uncharacterized protein (DUF934 family)
MQIIRNREIVEDGREFVAPEEWREGLGVRLNDTDPEALADQLPKWDAVAIEFPKYTDGRGYSLARLLRERYGYTGELRAVGDVLHDQLMFMERCGFDAYELKAGKDIQGALAAFHAISVRYQPASDQPLPLWKRAARS